MANYYVDYNGILEIDNFSGTLEDAKCEADKHIYHSKADVELFDIDAGITVARRSWRDTPYDPQDAQNAQNDPVCFEDGYYTDWMDKTDEWRKYHIDYHTGAGNSTFFGTLDEAKLYADRGVCYTQESVTISDDETGETVGRSWCGVDYDPQCEDEEQDDPIFFGTFGYYTDWHDWYR